MHSGKETFTNKLKFTEEQLEQDQIYGISENGQKRLEVDWDNKHVTYYEHYYYEYENSMYELVDQKINDADWTGTFNVEGNKHVAQVEGKYKYYLKSHAQQKININKAKVSATFTFEKTDKGIAIKDVKVQQNGHQLECFINAFQLYKQ